MDWIQKKLNAYGDRIACYQSDHPRTYHDLLQSIEAAAECLPAEGQAVIAIQTTGIIAGLAALIAIARRKHIALPLPPELPAAEQAKLIEIAAPAYRITSSGNRLELQSIRPESRPPSLAKQLQAQQHAGLILFSSGTSGEPKAMLHDLDALLNRYQHVKPRSDRSLLLLLIDHIGGLDSAFRTLFAGSTLVVPEERTPDAAGRAIAAHAVNVLPASPTFLNLMLLAHTPEKYDCSSVEIIAYGAETMSPSLLRRVAHAFPRADLQQKFGTSETGAIRIKSTGKDSLYFTITDADTDWKIVDDELWLKSPSRILGYLNADERSLEADGWYRTGDLVEEGPDGSLRIIGRESAIINVGGQKVHPSEIEAVLSHLPEIEACHVYSVPDPITGSAIGCKIVSRNEHELRAWKRLIRNHCRGKLAPWKIPSHLTISGELDVNARLKKQSG